MTTAFSVEAGPLNSLIDGVHALVDEARFRFTEDGLRVTAVDAANIAMTDLHLERTAFKTYPDPEELSGTVVVGVDLSRLSDITGMADAAQILRFEIDPDSGTFDAFVDDFEYTSGLLDAASIRHEPDLPDLDLPVVAMFEAGDLKRGLKAADLVDDQVEILTRSGSGELLVVADGDTDEVELRLRPGEELDEPIPDEATARSVFSLDYLKNVMTGIPSSNNDLTVEVGDEFPLVVRFGESSASALHGVYNVAPRVSN